MSDTGEKSILRGRHWWVRGRAVLAAGLVLGIGAAVTLAAWTDQSHAEGEFTASTFVVEANASTPHDPEGAWSPGTGSPVALEFAAEAMTPGARRYASLALRTGTGSDGGMAELSGADVEEHSSPENTPSLAAALRYRVVVSESCGIEAFAEGARFIVSGAAGEPVPLDSGQNADAALELAAATPEAPGASLYLCAEISLPSGADSALQGAAATARWAITSRSHTGIPPSAPAPGTGWTDETRADAAVSTAVIPAPQMLTCRYRPGLLGLGARVEITWRPPQEYNPEDIDYHRYTAGLGSLLQPITGFDDGISSVRNAAGTITTTIRAGLLGGALGLGSELHVVMRTKDASGWTSEPVVVLATSGLLIGLGSNCAEL